MSSPLKKNKIWFIVNPISGVGKQHIIEKNIEKYLDKSNFIYTVKYTQKAEHAKEIAKEAVDQKIDIVAIVGGDGSVNEAASSLINTNTKLAIIPSGSGNGFARSLGIPVNIKKAIKNLNKGKEVIIDTLNFNNQFASGLVGIGFDAHVAHEFKNYRKRGFLSYIKITIKEFLNYQGINLTITTDKEKKSYSNLFLISIANSQQFGNNACIAPIAKLDDGLLDICMIEKFPFWYAPILAIRLFNKSIRSSKYVHYLQNKKISINTNETKIHYDGETSFINKNLTINISPLNLRVYL